MVLIRELKQVATPIDYLFSALTPEGEIFIFPFFILWYSLTHDVPPQLRDEFILSIR